jgi:hypothetical protein
MFPHHPSVIASETGDEIPEPVATFVRATNTGRLDELLGVFVDDAMVNDQFREHWNKEAITRWATDEIIATRFTMNVRRVTRRYDQVVLSAVVDGDFDKRDLPDPLVLAFYFSVRGDKVVQLVVVRNESDG